MIAVSMSMMLGLQGLYDGMTYNMIDKSKRSDSGDISLYAKKYRVDRDIKHSIQNVTQVQEELLALEAVKRVVLRVRADGLVSTARKSSFATINGIDLEAQEKFGRFSEFLKSGEVEFKKRGAIIGQELAKTLKVRIGSKIIFSTQDALGEINSIALKVRGIVQTTNIVLDNSAIYIDIKKLHKFLGTPSPSPTQIAITRDEKKLLQRLKKEYPS